jgi:Uncharacterized protein conserved in bacteria C-term(DUF2220).
MSPGQFADKVDPYEILKGLHILRNPASVWVRGHGRILFQNGDVMTLSAYSTPFAMTRSLVESIVTVETKALLTIENLTTFNDYEPSREDLVVYTNGYANSLVVRFLQIVLRDCGCSTPDTSETATPTASTSCGISQTALESDLPPIAWMRRPT